MFMSHFEPVLNTLSNCKANCLIACDFSIDLFKAESCIHIDPYN